MAQTLVHLIYVHGFQGNDTTFQSFPTDLQRYLTAHLPAHLGLKIQSSLYPTYKSVKPISFATKNFLEWLSTQPPGPVILLGHSMGGLLTAEAATDISNNPERHPGAKPRRIMGMIAFDTPYLGMHPHVVVSGIASLLTKDEDEDGKQKKTVSEMNDHSQVKMVDEKVTDDWDAFKKNLNARSSNTSLSSHSYLPMLAAPHTPPRSPSPNFGLPPSPLIDRTLSFLSSHSDDPLVRWVRKHGDEPFSAGKRWAIEHFQFGVSMFDPTGLKERYARLVAWQGGKWINYWTETVPKPLENGGTRGSADMERDKAEEVADNDIALLETGIPDLSHPSSPLPDTTDQPTSTSMPTPGGQPESTSVPTSTSDDPPTPVLGALTKSETKAAEKAVEKATKAREKEIRQAVKEREKEVKQLQKQRDAQVKAASKSKTEQAKAKMKAARHFIVLPTGLGRTLGGGEMWEKVRIEGVGDEVAAHTGLFIRDHNLDYEGFVERVGRRVLGWCEEV